MAYTFKARCANNTQAPDGSHVATFDNGAVIPSKDWLFDPGSEYSFSVDGKFAKSAPPAPVKPAVVPAKVLPKQSVPVAPVAPKPIPQVLPVQSVAPKPVFKP